MGNPARIYHARDFETLPQPSGFAVNVHFPEVEGSLARFREVYGLEIPDYQRGNVWTRAQKISYIEWLVRGGPTGLEIKFNHPNFDGDSTVGNMELVDGLQRLTAVQEFVKSEFGIFEGLKYDDFASWDSRPSLLFAVYAIKTRREVLEWYIDLNWAGAPHTDEDLRRVKILLEKERKKEN
jgi:uncharacterized protein with ParB-like and HNH nuclease domain